MQHWQVKAKVAEVNECMATWFVQLIYGHVTANSDKSYCFAWFVYHDKNIKSTVCCSLCCLVRSVLAVRSLALHCVETLLTPFHISLQSSSIYVVLSVIYYVFHLCCICMCRGLVEEGIFYCR